jgi:hypothetical protein
MAIEHSEECLAAMRQQKLDWDAEIDAKIAQLHADGVDTSLWGWGMQYLCTCGARPNVPHQPTYLANTRAGERNVY